MSKLEFKKSEKIRMKKRMREAEGMLGKKFIKLSEVLEKDYVYFGVCDDGTKVEDWNWDFLGIKE